MYQRSKDNCRRKCAPTYEGSSSPSSSPCEPYRPRDCSSYTLVRRTEIAIGNTEIYIMIIYETWIAGCNCEMLTHAVPAVRVETAWNQPSRTLMFAGRPLTTVLPS